MLRTRGGALVVGNGSLVPITSQLGDNLWVDL